MKKQTGFILLMLFSAVVQGQSVQYDRHLIRLYEDNDFINIKGDGTDQGYSSGLKLDYYHEASRSFLSTWFTRDHPGTINTFHMGLSQLIFTPHNLETDSIQQDDYPYTGALFSDFDIRLDDPDAKEGLKVLFQAGIMGPSTKTKEVQQFIHRVIGDEKPNGWDNQLPDDILLNLSITGEKEIFHIGKWAEAIGGGEISAGSMLNEAVVYTFIRAGKINPYFEGFISHFTGRELRNGQRKKNTQFYLTIRPSLSCTFYNSLLQGGLILKKQGNYFAEIQHFTTGIDYGAVLSTGKFSITFTQRVFSSRVKGQGSQEVGNISMLYSW
jgi:hypothetical protein